MAIAALCAAKGDRASSAGAEDSSERGRLCRVSERRARAVQLDARTLHHASGGHDHRRLSGSVWRSEARAAAVAADGAFLHRRSGRRVPSGQPNRARTDAFRAHISIGALIEGEAAAVEREHTGKGRVEGVLQRKLEAHGRHHCHIAVPSCREATRAHVTWEQRCESHSRNLASVTGDVQLGCVHRHQSR